MLAVAFGFSVRLYQQHVMLQTFQSDQQSSHSSLCEVLQSSSVTVTHEDEPSTTADAVLTTTGTCNISTTGGYYVA